MSKLYQMTELFQNLLRQWSSRLIYIYIYIYRGCDE